MLASALITKVSNAVKDTSFSNDDILALLNEGQLDIAGGGTRQHGLPLVAPLPELLTSGTISATSNAVSKPMPSDYHRGAFMVVDASGEEITQLGSQITYLERYPILEVGSTDVCNIVGTTFYYAPAETQTITLHYYRKPVDMETTDEPDGIPVHLQERLLVNYAAWKMYSIIERGIDGNKNLTIYHMSEYQQALTDLERFIGPEEGRAQLVYDETNYIGAY